jgi:hypothetical protein
MTPMNAENGKKENGEFIGFVKFNRVLTSS